MNSVYLPMAGGGWTNLSPAAATLKPTGLSHIFNATCYNLARVIASRISVTLSPADAADNFQLTITPSSTTNIPSTCEVAMAQNYNKWKQISVGTPIASQTVRNEVSQSALLGVREQAIIDDLSGEFVCGYATDPAQPFYWVINFEPDNGGTSAASAAMTVVLEHEVELWGNSDANQPVAFVQEGTTPTKKPCDCCGQ